VANAVNAAMPDVRAPSRAFDVMLDDVRRQRRSGRQTQHRSDRKCRYSRSAVANITSNSITPEANKKQQKAKYPRDMRNRGSALLTLGQSDPGSVDSSRSDIPPYHNEGGDT
jgi:hypothetical protein